MRGVVRRNLVAQGHVQRQADSGVDFGIIPVVTGYASLKLVFASSQNHQRLVARAAQVGPLRSALKSVAQVPSDAKVFGVQAKHAHALAHAVGIHAGDGRAVGCGDGASAVAPLRHGCAGCKGVALDDQRARGGVVADFLRGCFVHQHGGESRVELVA